MGTTTLYVNFGRKDTKQIKEFFANETNYETEKGKSEVVYQSIKGNAIYEAVRYENKNTGLVEVYALVTKFGFDDGEIWFKHMDETMHPFYYDAPMKLINMLSPTTNKNANEWRSKAIEIAENKKSKPKVDVGDKIKFTKPINFTNGYTDDTFEYCVETGWNGRKKKYFRAVHGRFDCKITKWREKEFEVIKGETVNA